MIAALPDGITEKNTFEIKCPTTDNISIKKENKEGKITERYLAQVQIQM